MPHIALLSSVYYLPEGKTERATKAGAKIEELIFPPGSFAKFLDKFRITAQLSLIGSGLVQISDFDSKNNKL